MPPSPPVFLPTSGPGPAGTLSPTPQNAQTARKRAEIREAIVQGWTEIFIAILQADLKASDADGWGIDRG